MKIVLSILFLMPFTFQVFSQNIYNENRYRQVIFDEVTIQNDVEYGSAPQWIFPYWNETLKLNVYQPTDDLVSNRPLIIFAHAGGFLNGSKDVDDMVALCDSFARKGYVTATIDYRKGFNPLDAESAQRAVYRGIQDGKAAVRYFKHHAETYGIDTNFVYFGGMSAGGFIALHVAYMDLESERPQSTYGGGTVNNLGCLDWAGKNFAVSSEVRGVLNYWGAIQDTINIVANDTPLLLMHGTDDPTVPFNYGQPFGLFTLPYVYGSEPIQKRVENLGIYHEFYTSSVPDLHMLDGSNNGTFENPPTAFWYDTLLPRTTDFLVKLTKPNPTRISPENISLCHNESFTFEIDGSSNNYYRWTLFENTSRTVLSDTSNTLNFTFSNPGTYDLAVVEFNEVFCSSDTIWFHIEQFPELTPTLNGDSNIVLCDQEVGHFSVNGSTGNIFEWTVISGGESEVLNTQADSINMIFTAPGIHQISIVEQNENGCTSEPITISITQDHPVSASFTSENLTYTVVDFTNTSTNAVSYHWDFNDGYTSALENPSHHFALNGDYNILLTVTSNNGCQNTYSQTISILHLSLDAVAMESVRIYPNPVMNELHIVNEKNAILSFEIYDLHGKTILNEQEIKAFEHRSIQTENWESGTYFIQIIDQNNSVNIHKIVK